MSKQAYYQAEGMDDEEDLEEEDEEESANPRDVGHNIYILAHQVSAYSKGWNQMLEGRVFYLFPRQKREGVQHAILKPRLYLARSE